MSTESSQLNPIITPEQVQDVVVDNVNAQLAEKRVAYKRDHIDHVEALAIEAEREAEKDRIEAEREAERVSSVKAAEDKVAAAQARKDAEAKMFDTWVNVKSDKSVEKFQETQRALAISENRDYDVITHGADMNGELNHEKLRKPTTILNQRLKALKNGDKNILVDTYYEEADKDGRPVVVVDAMSESLKVHASEMTTKELQSIYDRAKKDGDVYVVRAVRPYLVQHQAADKLQGAADNIDIKMANPLFRARHMGKRSELKASAVAAATPETKTKAVAPGTTNNNRPVVPSFDSLFPDATEDTPVSPDRRVVFGPENEDQRENMDAKEVQAETIKVTAGTAEKANYNPSEKVIDNDENPDLSGLQSSGTQSSEHRNKSVLDELDADTRNALTEYVTVKVNSKPSGSILNVNQIAKGFSDSNRLFSIDSKHVRALLDEHVGTGALKADTEANRTSGTNNIYEVISSYGVSQDHDTFDELIASPNNRADAMIGQEIMNLRRRIYAAAQENEVDHEAIKELERFNDEKYYTQVHTRYADKFRQEISIITTEQKNIVAVDNAITNDVSDMDESVDADNFDKHDRRDLVAEVIGNERSARSKEVEAAQLAIKNSSVIGKLNPKKQLRLRKAKSLANAAHNNKRFKVLNNNWYEDTHTFLTENFDSIVTDTYVEPEKTKLSDRIPAKPKEILSRVGTTKNNVTARNSRSGAQNADQVRQQIDQDERSARAAAHALRLGSGALISTVDPSDPNANTTPKSNKRSKAAKALGKALRGDTKVDAAINNWQLNRQARKASFSRQNSTGLDILQSQSDEDADKNLTSA